MNKVAEISLIFWLLKVVATTLGETLGDFISMTLGLGYLSALGITFLFFVVIVLFQVRSKQYVPFLFWLVIIGTTTLGTEISDFIDRSLHLGYAWGSLLLISLLVGTFILWYRKYGNLEVYPIFKSQKEYYYWTAILISNSLGTAFGDYLSDDIGLSYLTGAMVTGAIILVIVLIHYFSKANHIILFWIAFVFTRPFGATFGDFLTKPLSKGGLNLGTLNATLVSVGIMAVLIWIHHRQHTRRLTTLDPEK